MLNSEELRFFQQLAKHPSLAAAARALNVTPSSVTQRLQGMEEKLGLRLLNRQSRHLSLTDAGQLLLERAQFILADLDALQEALSESKQEMAGRLRIHAPLGFGNRYVAPLAAQFQAEHKNVVIELVLSDSPNLAAGEDWDIVIHIGALPDSSLVKAFIAPNQRFLCAAPAYLARHGKPRSIDDLRSHDCIALRENAEDVTLWRLRAPGAERFEAIRIRPKLASNDGRVVKQWTLDAYGIMLRSEWDVADQLRSAELERVLPDHALPDADVVALFGAGPQSRSLRTTRFLELLKQSLTPAPWRAGASKET